MTSGDLDEVVESLDSKDKKQRLRGLEALEEALEHEAPNSDEWQQVLAPLVGTLRDTNFKVCLGALCCLEALVGHVGGDIVPFLSSIVPAVVESLGTAKSSVQDKGVDVLLAISNPVVNGSSETLDTLGGFFRHKNWRVREYLVKYLGEATVVDGAGVVSRPELATVLADALNDSASQVRQQALIAAARVVELTGTSLMAKLEAKGVRSVQLTTLRNNSPQACKSHASTATTAVNSTSGGFSGVVPHSPTLRTPAPPSRAGVSSFAGGGRVTGAGGGSAGAGARGRLIASRKRLLRGGGADGTGVEGWTSPPRSQGLSAKSSAAGSVPAGTLPADEESAFSALEPLVPIKVYTEKDVRREVEAGKVELEHKTDWQSWVGAMRRLAGLALGGGAREFPGVLAALVRGSVHEAVAHKVSENRSAVAREACRCVAVLARCLKNHFGSLAELWLPEVLRNTTRAVVVAAAGDEAARAIFGCTTDGFPRLLMQLSDGARNKSAAIRRRCQEYVMVALARWGDSAFERHLTPTRDMVAVGIEDADSSVRATARRAFWMLNKRFLSQAEFIMESLDASTQRHVLREAKEFDVEAFVRATKAAAESPQLALGESVDEDFASESSDATPSSRSATSRDSPDPRPSARGFVSYGVVHNVPPSSSPSSSSTSSASKSREVTSLPAPKKAVSTSGTIHGEGMKRVKIERGVSNGGGGGRVKIGSKVSRGGPVEEPPVRIRPKQPLPADVQDSPAGNPFGADATSAPPLRVANGSTGRSTSPDGLSGFGVSNGSVGHAVAGSKSGPLRVARSSALGAGAGAPAGSSLSLRDTPSGHAHPRSGLSSDTERFAFEGPQRRVVRRAPAPSTAPTAQGDAGPGTGLREASAAGSSGIRAVAGPEGTSSEGAKATTRDGNEAGGGQNGEGGGSRASAVDRREVLRQMDALLEQAGESHWAARVEALDGLSRLLTSSSPGGGGSGGDLGAEGGCLVLALRSISKRLEAVIAERIRDAHFRVATAALRLLSGLVEACPTLMAAHSLSLLPLVFPSLADAKEPVRRAASRTLDACRAAYSPHQLCAALCPRFLELGPGRARTGLLEFLMVLVPHASSFLAEPGHLRALTQRLGTALIQHPPPSNWDGGHVSSIGGGSGGTAEDHGTSSPSASSSGIATARLLAALFRLDRDALAVAVGSVTMDAAAAVRQALVRSIPEARDFLPTKQQRRADKAGVVSAMSAAGAGIAAPARSPVTIAGSKMGNGQGLVHDDGLTIAKGEEQDSWRARQKSARVGDVDEGARFRDATPRQRQPLGTLTPQASNVVKGDLAKNDVCPASRPTWAVKKGDCVGQGSVFDASAPITAGNPEVEMTSPPSTPVQAQAEPAEAARRLIDCLSPGARTHQKVAALSSLRSLADGQGAGARPEFWPRYFGQMLMLLLEGASSAGIGGSGVESSPSRRRTMLRVKHLQGVRCLVARRGTLFPGMTEVVVGRLVEIGGGPCHAVRHEAEACLADLVGVLEPSRFLSTLVPLLVPGNGPVPNDEGQMGTVGTASQAAVQQCVALGALCALTPRLSSPELLGALGAGPLLRGLEVALGGKDLEARRRAVLVLVEVYQVLEEALLPFISRFPTSRLKLITMYIEQRQAQESQNAAPKPGGIGLRQAPRPEPQGRGGGRRASLSDACLPAAPTLAFLPIR